MANTHSTILNAVKTVLTAALSPVTVVRRKKQRKRKADVLPLVVVSGGKGFRDEHDSEGYFYGRYEVFAGIYYAGNQIIESSFNVEELAETLTNALDATSLSGVSSVWNVELMDVPSYEAEIDDDVDFTLISFNFFTHELKD